MPVYEYEDKDGNVKDFYVPSWKQRDSVPDMKRRISKSNIKIGTYTHIPDAMNDYKNAARQAETNKNWRPTDNKGNPYSRRQIQDAMSYHERQCKIKGEKRLILA